MSASKLREVKTKPLVIDSMSKKEGGIDIRISVRQIKNGFIINKSTEGKNSKTKEWEYKSEEYYSEDNPLEIKTEDKTLAELFTK